ncbi:hypothetical protein [Devosia nitrariae]|uniref:DUF998 domain-containing protein n=1 Tax=Devosia nitrariae TaxID=2071872 RepID=A0ABQ5WCN5_9HYPH|nr:hypothetical protein [Devosia nitrariae]GLQ57265.1 hypothetical protein GCM10010862_45240 [Devosia nitrariae]
MARRAPALIWALSLFLLAPLIGEFLLGNLPITFLPALIALAPLYGGGALLIRETARRAGLGWPGMLLLCLAFGVIEEAFVTQSLFDPDYLGLGLTAHAEVPWLGIGMWWTVFVLGLHAVWSTAVPIALIETLAGAERETSWLGRFGLAVTALLFLAGCAMTVMFEQSSFIAAPHQFAIAAIAVVALVVGAFMQRGRAGANDTTRTAPRPPVAGLAAFAAGSIFLGLAYLRDIPNAWVSAALMLLTAAAFGLTLRYWSRRDGWTQTHRFAVAAGMTLTYVWFGFLQVPSIGGVDLMTDLVGNAVFSAAAIALLFAAGMRVRREGDARR